MSIYVARYSDGSCAIVQANNVDEARKVCESEDVHFVADRCRIINLRELKTPLAIRWYFDGINSSELIEVDRLTGFMSDAMEWEIFQHEYPAIADANKRSEEREPYLPKNAPPNTPIVDCLPQMEKWRKSLIKHLRLAIKLEMKRKDMPA